MGLGIEVRDKEWEGLKERVPIQDEPGCVVGDSSQDVFPPSQDIEQGVFLPTRIRKGIKPPCKGKPEPALGGTEGQEGFRLRACLPPALVSIVYQVTHVLIFIPCRMKEAPNKPVIFVQVSKGPATKACNRDYFSAVYVKCLCIFSQQSFYYFFMLDVFITCLPDGRTAGETGFFVIRQAQCGEEFLG